KVGRCASVAGEAGRRSAAGHAANAGTNTSGAGGLYPIEAWGLIGSCCSGVANSRGRSGPRVKCENLAVEQLIEKAGVETLDVAALPGAAPLDVGGLGTDNRDPVLHRLGDELRSVVGPDVSGNAPQDEQVGQNVDHIDRLELAGDTDRQTFVGELVEHVE